MNNAYYEMMDKMEKHGVDQQYIDGWACGYLHNPRRGEQYLSPGYEAGYSDGMEGVTDGYQQWIRKVS